MIDSAKFKKMYEKIQLQENIFQICVQIGNMCDAHPDIVMNFAKEDGLDKLDALSPEQYDQLCHKVKSSQNLVTPNTQKKVPIKDEENLNAINLNEDPQDPVEAKTTPEESNSVPLDLLYDIIYSYYLATKQPQDATSDKAKKFITLLNNSSILQSMERKYSSITSKSEIMVKQDSKKPTPTILKTYMTKMFNDLAAEQKKEVQAAKKNP